MAYFAVDKKREDARWRFAGFIQARTLYEAHNKLNCLENLEEYKIVGYAIRR